MACLSSAGERRSRKRIAMTWNVHPQLWGRSAGMSVTLADTLVCDDAVRAVAEVTAAGAQVAVIDAELCAMLAAPSGALTPERRRHARQLRRAIRAGRDVARDLANDRDLLFQDLGLDRAHWATLVELRAHHRTALARASERAGQIVEAARQRERHALHQLMRDRRVRAAAALTSRSLADGLARISSPDRALRGGPASLGERRALLFLQRLTAKPAMLADVGPCFWGVLDRDHSIALRSEAGPALIRTRRVDFEHWAIVALARRVQADPDVAPHCVVRLNPGCLIDGTTLFYPIGQRLRLEPREAQVLRWCSEDRTLGELRRMIAERPDEERAMLDRLLDNHLTAGVASYDIPVPALEAPEHGLRDFLAHLPDTCVAKQSWTAVLDQMIALRDELACDPDGDARALVTRRLDAVFREATGAAPTRNPGKLHGARFVTYEDCLRDVEITLGGAIACDLDTLAPVLDLASWIVHACAARYEQKLLPIHARLARNLHGVDFMTFVRETKWITDTPEVVSATRSDLDAAWSRQLGSRLAGDRPLVLTPEDFRGVIAQLAVYGSADDGSGDPADPADWLPAADCHALSVLGAAGSASAFAAGHYELVLDKLYKGVPMWIHPAPLAFCPDRAATLTAFEAWCRAPILQFVDPASSSHRSNLNLPVVDALWEATIPHAAPRGPADRVVPCGELEVVQERGRLYVCSHDRRIRAGLFAVRWPFLQHKLLELSVVPALTGHSCTPRVTMGRWILSRAQWRFAAEPLARQWDRARAMIAVAAWQAEHGIPDRVFVKVAGQAKSVALDLRSVLQCDLLRALVARNPELRVTEMMPAPAQCWLADRHAVRMVSELRFTALRRRKE
jgi:hypothetical protein